MKYTFRNIHYLFLIFLFLLFINLIALTIVQAEDNQENEKVNENFQDFNISFDDWYNSNSKYSIDNLNNSKIPKEVKGLYITGRTANSQKFDYLVDLLNQTELNSLVIDVKEDSGYLTYKSNVPEVNEISSDKAVFIEDIDLLMKKAKDNNIYTIARIVTFKDPFYAGAKPEIAMQRKTGGVWRDRSGISWVDPYNKEVWDYNVAIAKEAAEKGFDEIQFDYVRFPENGKLVDREVEFNNPENHSKAEIIADFLAYAKEELKDYPVYISADLFGLTTTAADDMGIGQQWELITSVVDYISPMMYPSHYAKGSYGIPVPDADPYGIIKNGLEDAIEKNEKVSNEGKTTSTIRPWYQDFTASYLKTGYIVYGPEEINLQIQAGNELGINEYLMWNARNVYNENAWLEQ